MIQTYRRELTDPFNLSEWVMDTLAVAYDLAKVEVTDEQLGDEAGRLVEAAAGTPYHPGSSLEEPEYSQAQVFQVYEMALERSAAIRSVGSSLMGRVRLRMQHRQVTSAGS